MVAIQDVVNGIRSPTPPSTLGENITQIITIVAGIVAVCKDNLPPNSVQKGREHLKRLSDNANKLSELQAGTPDTIMKESRQVDLRYRQHHEEFGEDDVRLGFPIFSWL